MEGRKCRLGGVARVSAERNNFVFQCVSQVQLDAFSDFHRGSAFQLG